MKTGRCIIRQNNEIVSSESRKELVPQKLTKAFSVGNRNAICSKLLLSGVRESSIPHPQQMASLYFNIFSVYNTYNPRVCRMAHFCFSTAPKFRFVLTSSSYLPLYIFIHLIVSLPYSKYS